MTKSINLPIRNVFRVPFWGMILGITAMTATHSWAAYRASDTDLFGNNEGGGSKVSYMGPAVSQDESGGSLSYPLNRVSFDSEPPTLNPNTDDASDIIDAYFGSSRDVIDFNSSSNRPYLGPLGASLNEQLGSINQEEAADSMCSATKGLYWDEDRGINLDSIWGDVTNLQKDTSSLTKQMIAGQLGGTDFTSLSTSSATIGTPVEYIDLGPTGIATVVYESQIPLAMEAQYAALTDYAAALGPVGNMDYRNGVCFIDGHDYTGTINAYIFGPALKFEGVFPWLHLDTNCWVTIGLGSAMFDAHKKGSLKGYQAYFNKMEYVDADGLPVPQKIKDKDMEKFFALEKTCIDNGGSNNRTERSYKGLTKGRHITRDSMFRIAFEEACQRKVKQLHTFFKAEAAVQKNNRSFKNLSPSLQLVILDISYQGGVNRFDKGGSLDAMRRGIVNGSPAAIEKGIDAFKKTVMYQVWDKKKKKYVLKYIERNKWRFEQLRNGDTQLKQKTNPKSSEQRLKNKKTGKITTVKQTSKKGGTKSKKK